MYTARFSERWQLVDVVYGANVGANTETNSGYSDVSAFSRLVVIVHPVDLNDDVNVDIEEATDTDGTDEQTITSKNATVASGDTAPTVIELRGAEMDVADHFETIQVELTTADTGGGSNYFVAEVWGETVYPPADTSNLDQVVD